MILRLLQAYDDWTERMYVRSCRRPRIVWRFWFEVTGQGAEARRYRRRMGFKRRASRTVTEQIRHLEGTQ